MKKILLVSHELTYTGAPRSLLNMAIELRRCGYSVKVISLRDGNFKTEFETENFAVEIVKQDWNDVIPLLEESDLVFANTIFSLQFAHFAQQYSEVVLIIREANNIKEICICGNIDENLIYEIRKIVCVSEYAKICIEKIYGIDGINVMHNFIYSYKGKKTRHIVSKRINFVISGTVEERKQQHIVIKAYNMLPPKIRNLASLHIIGRMPNWSEYYWSQFLQCDKNVVFHGEIADRNELYKLYSEMDVFIVASTDESCSLVALEAAMLGKGLIISNHVGASYILGDSRFIFTVGDINQLAWEMAQMTSRKVRIIQGIKNYINYVQTSTEKIYRRNLIKLIEE